MKPSYNIVLAEEQELSQSEEYFLVEIDGVKKKIDLHDYLTIYQYPWLYDVLLYEHLGCKTPFEICQVLDKVFTDSNVNRSHINMLEIGAGSGIFADTLRKIIGVQRISGLDLYEAAKSAAERDRPGLYQEYYVADLTALSADMIKQLSEKRFNCIGVASATGWGNHIPVAGFEQAFNLLIPSGWFVFHVKPNDPDPECIALNHWIEEKIQSKRLDLKAKQSCFHRYNMQNEAIYYDVIIGTKA